MKEKDKAVLKFPWSRLIRMKHRIKKLSNGRGFMLFGVALNTLVSQTQARCQFCLGSAVRCLGASWKPPGNANLPGVKETLLGAC